MDFHPLSLKFYHNIVLDNHNRMGYRRLIFSFVNINKVTSCLISVSLLILHSVMPFAWRWYRSAGQTPSLIRLTSQKRAAAAGKRGIMLMLGDRQIRSTLILLGAVCLVLGLARKTGAQGDYYPIFKGRVKLNYHYIQLSLPELSIGIPMDSLCIV